MMSHCTIDKHNIILEVAVIIVNIKFFSKHISGFQPKKTAPSENLVADLT